MEPSRWDVNDEWSSALFMHTLIPSPTPPLTHLSHGCSHMLEVLDEAGSFNLQAIMKSPSPCFSSSSSTEMVSSAAKDCASTAFCKEAAMKSAGKRKAKSNKEDKREPQPKKREKGPKLVIRTKSEVDIIEDGYKWRKYGQKPMKNSTYARRYYRCTNSECRVKKHVERDACEPAFVVTTYEGIHNHMNPNSSNYSLLHFTHHPFLISADMLNFIPPIALVTADASSHLQQQPHAPQLLSTMMLSGDGGLLQDVVPPQLRDPLHV